MSVCLYVFRVAVRHKSVATRLTELCIGKYHVRSKTLPISILMFGRTVVYTKDNMPNYLTNYNDDVSV